MAFDTTACVLEDLCSMVLIMPGTIKTPVTKLTEFQVLHSIRGI